MADMLKLVRTLPDGKLIVVEDSLRHLSRVTYQNGICLDDVMDDWADLLDQKTHDYYKSSNTVPVANVEPVANTPAPLPEPNGEPVSVVNTIPIPISNVVDSNVVFVINPSEANTDSEVQTN